MEVLPITKRLLCAIFGLIILFIGILFAFEAHKKINTINYGEEVNGTIMTFNPAEKSILRLKEEKPIFQYKYNGKLHYQFLEGKYLNLDKINQQSRQLILLTNKDHSMLASPNEVFPVNNIVIICFINITGIICLGLAVFWNLIFEQNVIPQ